MAQPKFECSLCQNNRLALSGSFTMRDSLLNIIVARVADVYGSQCGSSLIFGSPFYANEIHAALIFAASARASAVPPVIM
jgi:hypothetical protein